MLFLTLLYILCYKRAMLKNRFYCLNCPPSDKYFLINKCINVQILTLVSWQHSSPLCSCCISVINNMWFQTNDRHVFIYFLHIEKLSCAILIKCSISIAMKIGENFQEKKDFLKKSFIVIILPVFKVYCISGKLLKYLFDIILSHHQL